MNTVHDLSYALVARALDVEGWIHSPTPDGSILTVFDHGNFLVSVEGSDDEILVVTGLLDVHATADNVTDVDDIVDEWHRRQMWPTINRADINDDGTGELTTEVAGYFPHGASCEQVRTQLRCAVGSTKELAHRLAVALGD